MSQTRTKRQGLIRKERIIAKYYKNFVLMQYTVSMGGDIARVSVLVPMRCMGTIEYRKE